MFDYKYAVPPVEAMKYLLFFSMLSIVAADITDVGHTGGTLKGVGTPEGVTVAGAECESKDGRKGSCIKISDCTTNEWLFGQMKSPICDEPGANYKMPDTKVCCFEAIKIK